MTEKELSTQFIRHDFTEDEKRNIATDMAIAVSEIERLEDEKKAVMSDFKGQIDAKQAELNAAARHLNTGYEMRSVKCEVERNYEKREIWYWLDGRVVKTRPMTQDEIQIKFEL